ncbi:MAG TPA: methyltransferase domain-containing protein [Candidatus Binatia bacterium]
MAQSTSWNPQRYAENARFVSDLGEPLLALLAPRPKEVILDLGCGDGALSEKIGASGCALYAVDASFAQIEAARKRGLQALVMDGQWLSFKPFFDAVFTNAALHWMKQPEKVVAGVSYVLKPGGRFVGELGGKGNIDIIRAALHAALRRRAVDPESVDPWYYPSPAEYSDLLQQAGFRVEYIELIPRPTPLPGDIEIWLEIFAQPFTKAVNESERESLVAEVRAELEPKLRNAEGIWVADYVRLRFRAVKQGQTDHGSKTIDH